MTKLTVVRGFEISTAYLGPSYPLRWETMVFKNGRRDRHIYCHRSRTRIAAEMKHDEVVTMIRNGRFPK